MDPSTKEFSTIETFLPPSEERPVLVEDTLLPISPIAWMVLFG